MLGDQLTSYFATQKMTDWPFPEEEIELEQPTVLEKRVTPPDGLFDKIAFYSRRYGLLHALLSFLGRQSPALWSMIGPHVTRRHLEEQLSDQDEIILNLGGVRI